MIDAGRWVMWRLAMSVLAAAALGLAAPAHSAPVPAPISAQAPEGFDILLLPQTTLVDVYFGGRRVGAVMARYSPGVIHFLQPSAALALIPNVQRAPTLLTALDGELPTHADQACDDEASGKCRRLEPETIGVIFDQGRFRADIFVNPAFLSITNAVIGRYLPTPQAGPSVAASLSGQIAGSARAGADFDVQGHMVAAYRDAHLTASLSQSSALGTRVDAIAAAVDHGPLRVQAGLLSSLPVDLIDQGHFYGVAIGSQTDTLVNRDQIIASPIPLYLANRAQVDILRNGRLVSSRQYPAGNQLIDTSSLPEGSYLITLRIREVGGYVHEETRSITKNSSLPPLGMPQFFAGAGVEALEGTTGIPRASTPFLQAGYGRRLSSQTSIGATAALIDGHAVMALALNYFTPTGWRVRAASLISSGSGYGLLLASSFNLNASTFVSMDIRQGWGEGDHHWTSNQVAAAIASGQTLTAFAPAFNGSQVTGAISSVWRGAQFTMTGAYHSAPFSKVNYVYGPQADIPIHLGHAGLRLVASATQTEHGLQAYLGLRMLFSRGHASVVGDAGFQSTSANGVRQTGPVADVTGTMTRTDVHLGETSGTAGFTHAPDGDTVTVGGQMRSRHGDFTGQIAQDFNGLGADTRYSAGFVMGAVLTQAHVAMGDPSGGNSGVMVRVEAPPGSDFEVLVNNAPRGVIRSGQTLPIMLPAYRVYSIRLAPKSASVLDFDTAARDVSLYPGNVQAMTWKATRIVEVFGRAVDARGNPVAEAVIQGGRYPGLTDENGYFQLEMSADGRLSLQASGGRTCEITVTGISAAATHLSIGARQCQVVMIAGEPKPAQVQDAPARGVADAKPGPSGLQPILYRPALGPMGTASPAIAPTHGVGRSLAVRDRWSGPRRLEPQSAHSRSIARPSRARRRGAVQLWNRAALRHRRPGGSPGSWQERRAPV